MDRTRKKQQALLCTVTAVIILMAVIPAVSAFTATMITPADATTGLHSGDVISIQINGLATGNQFTYRITSTDLETPGNTVTLSNLNMPFALADGLATTELKTTGITGTVFTVTRSDATQLILNGENIVNHNNIRNDTYDLSITGTKTGAAVGIDYSIKGPVTNASINPSTLSLTLANINTGHLTIEILDGATSVFSQVFTITVPATPVPEPQNFGDGGPSGPAAAAAGAPAAPQGAFQALLAPPGISPTTVTVQHNEEGKVLADYVVETDPAAGFASALGITTGTTVVSSTGQPVSELSVTPLDPATVPSAAAAQGGVFSFSGLSVECEPSGTQFVGGMATVSFSLTPAQWADALGKVNGNTQAMSIQFYDAAAQSWVDVPTTVDPVSHTVSAQVTHFSTFALFYKTTKDTASTSPQTYGELVTPAQTMGAPVKTPAGAMMAPPSTTQSPGLPGIVVIGLIGFVGYCVARKK